MSNKVNRFDNVPNDVVVYMALNYDLATITAFCQTSSRFNMLVCQNNNFWLQKLEKDFGLNRVDVENHRDNDYLTNPTPRRYYLYIDRSVNNIPNADLLYTRAVDLGDLGLVKVALSRGADINISYVRDMGHIESLLLKAYRNEHYDIADYLLEQGIINSATVARQTIGGILRIVDSYGDNNDKKIRLILALYGKVLPLTIKYIEKSDENKIFWNVVANKLQEFQDNPIIDINDIYQEWYQEYKNLAN